MELVQDLSLTVENVVLPGGGTVVGGSGTRSFTESAPAIGTSFVAPWGSYPNIICKSITTSPHYIDGTGWAPKYVANYSTIEPSVSGGESWTISTRVRPEEQISFNASVGAVSIDANGGNWRLTTDAEPSGEMKNKPKMTGKTTARVAEGTFTLPKVVQSSTPNATVATFIPKLGRINDGAFYGFSKGQVLFESFTATNRTAPSGVMQWLFNVVYHWKVIGGSVSDDDWNYVYSELGWRKPVQTVNDPSTGSFQAINFMYSRTDISI